MSRSRPSVLVLLMIAVALAGCVSEETPEAPDPDAADDPGDGPDPGKKPQRGADAPQPAAAPSWAVGDWWEWQVTPRDAAEYEVKTIVAEAGGDGHLLGWATAAMGLRSQFFHFIPSGELSADVAWGAHHEPVDWFDFPLTDGKTWTGSVWLADMGFTAEAGTVAMPDGSSQPGYLVSGADEEGGIRVELEWATGLGMFTSMRFHLHDEVPWLTLDLRAYGSGHTGDIHVLESDMVFARFTGLEHVPHGAPAPVPEVLTIPQEVTHVAVGCYLGGAPGYYSFRLTDSAGEGVDCEAHGASDWFGVVIDHGPVVPGQAGTAFLTAGQGTVFAELFLVIDDVRSLT